MSAVRNFQVLHPEQPPTGPHCRLVPAECAARRLWLFDHARSPHTRAAYRIALRLFLEAADADCVQSACMTPEKAVSSVCALQSALADKSVATRRARLSAVRKLLTLCESKRLFVDADGVPFCVSVDVILPREGEDGDVRMPFDVPGEDLALASIAQEPTPRNAILLRLMHLTGLRVSEIARLKWGHCKWRKGEKGEDVLCLVILRKRAKQDIVALRADVGADLWGWRTMLGREKGAEAIAAGASVFGLQRWSIYNVCKLAWARVGVDAETWPDLAKLNGGPGLGAHCRRHVHASVRIAKGAAKADVQHDLGHSSEATTAGYSHLAPRPVGTELE